MRAGSREQHRVDVVAHGAGGVQHPPQPRLARTGRGGPRCSDAARGQFVGAADHGGPVAGAHPVVPAGAGHHLAGGGAVVAVDHRHRRQVAVDLPKRRVAGCLGPRHQKVDAGRPDRVGAARQAGLDDRGGGEVGDVEDGAGAVVGGHRPAQHVVAQPGDHPHVWVGFPCQQGDFEILGVVAPGAHDGAGAGEVGAGEFLAGQLDDGGARAVQFLGDGGRQHVVTADDDVAARTHPG